MFGVRVNNDVEKWKISAAVMPSVISKYLCSNEVSEKFIGNREYLSKALIASSLILYGCKISYPIIKKVCHQSGKSNENNETFREVDDGKFIKTDIGVCLNDSDDDKSIKSINNNNKICTVNGNLIGGKSYPAENKKMSSREGECDVVSLKKKKINLKKATSPGFDKEFVIRLYKLLGLMIPRVFCLESGLLLIHTCALSLRTFMSIYVASMEGHMVKFIVRKDVKHFAFMLLKWLAVAVPATFINSMIRYLECKLALSFR